MKKPHSLVIGGSRGLGGVIARDLRAAGHTVSVISRTAPGANYRAGHWVGADITNSSETQRAVLAVRAKSGKISNLVFAQRFRGLDGAWEGELATTLKATHDIIEFSAANALAAKASIVAISSNAGVSIVEDQPAVYHASKAGLEQLVRYYAVRLGSRGVRVNAVAPCALVKDESRAHYARNKQLQAFYRNVSPLGRMITTRDVSHVVRWLVDPDCCLTGQSLVVDGGLSLSWPEAVAGRAGLFRKKKGKRSR